MTLPDLLAILRWTDDVGRPVADVVAAHIEARAASLAEISCNSQAVDQALQGVIGLDGSAALDVLDAPETLHFIQSARQGDEDGLVAFLREATSAELARSGLATVDRPVWSAKGDAYFRPDGERWSRPRLHGGVVIDARSPRAARPLAASAFRETELGPAIPWTSDEEEQAVSRVIAGWSRLERLSPAASTLVRSSARCLVLRQTEDRNAFTSSSSRRYVGRVMLMNPDTNLVTEEQLVSALLHESVHSFLYRLEHVAPFATSNESDDDVLISPWSGGRIRLQTYIHACFVYYALVRLWGPSALGTVPATSAARAEYDRAIAGFRGGAYLEPLVGYRDQIDPRIRVMLDQLGDASLSM